MPVPAPPAKCYMCGGAEFWWRGDTWICSKCHPNPNPADYKEPEYEKPAPVPATETQIFIGSDPTKAKFIQDAFQTPLDQLLARVKAGNDKLMAQWLVVRAARGDEEWEALLHNLSMAVQRLNQLCDILHNKGYHDCLYIENGKKVRSCVTDDKRDIPCWCCPSDVKYWVTELFGDNPPPEFRPKSRSEMAQFLRAMGAKI
jgi:hypothetical protein